MAFQHRRGLQGFDERAAAEDVRLGLAEGDGSSEDEEDGDELDLGSENVSAEDAPFVKLVNLMLTEAIKEGSTDVHIEPGRDNVNVRIRIDGVLVTIMSPPINSLNGMVTRIKILSKLLLRIIFRFDIF